MNATAFKFPPHQAVTLLSIDFDMVAVVAPSFTPGIHHVGVLKMIEQEGKLRTGNFISGPARVLTKSIWRKLATMQGGELWDCACPNIFGPAHDFSIPTRSLDDFIDLLTEGTPAAQ